MPKLLSIAVPVTRRGTKKAHKPAPAAEMAELPAAALARREPRPPSANPQHRYRIGQRLRLASVGSSMSRAAGLCRVLALLPPERGVFSYRVRSEIEGFDRVVVEADLALPDAHLP